MSERRLIFPVRLFISGLILMIAWPPVAWGDSFKIERKKYVRPASPEYFARPRRVTPRSSEPARADNRNVPKPNNKPIISEPAREEREEIPTGPLVKKVPSDGVDKGPLIRIALATDVAVANITSTQPLAYYNSQDDEMVALSTQQVKVQLGAGQTRERPGRVYRVQVANLKSSSEADQIAKKLRKRFNEPVEIHLDKESEHYEVSVGEFASQRDAQAFMVQVMNAGYKKTWVSKYEPSNAVMRSQSLIKALSVNGQQLAAVRERLVLGSQDEETAPLKFNGSPYRGRLEIFTNKRNRLSVINVLPMEDYVRGVVPNELSPTGFPQLEALKAQAVAARTYAVRNMGNFEAEGFDLLPTALSQVYGGKGTEHPLTDRAVQETWGMVAVYDDKPINALYTSTCGGRTESSEFVFTEAVPYLVSVTCSPQDRSRRTAPNDDRNQSDRTRDNRDSRDNKDRSNKSDKDRDKDRNRDRDRERDSERDRQLSGYRYVRTERRIEPVIGDGGRALTREIATLAILQFALPESFANNYLQASVNERDINRWLARLAELTGRPSAVVSKDATTLAGFAEVFSEILYGQDKPSALLTPADANYILGADANELPSRSRADVAALLQEGILQPAPDGSLHPRISLSRTTALLAISRALAKIGKPALETGTARSIDNRRIKIRSGKNKEPLEIELASDFYLFRLVNNDAFPSSNIEIIGGEKINYHLDSRGRIDYLEVQPNPNGAASDRFSVYSRWQVKYSPAELKARLAEARINVGDIVDLKGVKYGHSHRLAELKVIGLEGERSITGLRIRSALGLRESLFVILREYDVDGQISAYRFLGRGWGHGVGMCQVGAYGLALEGLDYQEILKTYYSGIELKKHY